MTRPGQVTLAQLLMSAILVAVVIGAVRLIVVLWPDPWARQTVVWPLVFAVPVLAGAAVGALASEPTTGAFWGAVVCVVVFVLAPAVMAAG
jgi:hypothetical protein